jgi:hypothetical protein
LNLIDELSLVVKLFLTSHGNLSLHGESLSLA